MNNEKINTDEKIRDCYVACGILVIILLFLTLAIYCLPGWLCDWIETDRIIHAFK